MTLKGLLTVFSAFMQENGMEYWIAHGTLLGWYWNQKLLPWDTDVDVQITSATLIVMATKFDMTELIYGPRWKRVKYLLDVNPYSRDISADDVANRIDARWIDTTNGKYIDITVLHSSGVMEFEIDSDGHDFFCKDGHRYLVSSYSPQLLLGLVY